VTARQLFPLRTRVRVSAQGRAAGCGRRCVYRVGLVVGYGRAPEDVRVAWPGRKMVQTWWVMYLERDDSEEARG